MNVLESIVLFLSIHFVHSSQVLRPRGVPLSRKAFYNPLKDFSCLDGSGTFSFELVNDDYCDCDDGSDEPGTAACSNSIFHCPNVGYFEKNIPSSRVNDGICDCCDASDEFNSSARCEDNCLVLGERAREEERHQLELLVQGSHIRAGYIEEAQKKMNEDRKELESVKEQLAEIEAVKKEKEDVKNAAEEKEKEVLDRIRKERESRKEAEKEIELQKAQEEERRIAETAFHQLDRDQNNLLTFQEVQTFPQFDRDNDGHVSEDEAKFFLHMKDAMDLEEFVTTGWVIAKPYYTRNVHHEHENHEEQSEPEAVTASPSSQPSEHIHEHESETHETEDLSHLDEGLPDETDEDEDEEDGKPYFPSHKDDFEKSSSPSNEEEYDEETKAIVEAAKKARDEFSSSESSFLDLSRKLRELEVSLETDYGPDGAFKALQGQCYELNDREYTYKLCPFDRASQRSKDGGSETSLGRWGKWSGPGHNYYSKMMYEGGSTCWNGPARSVAVSLKCGLSNQLLSAHEPSRCEYAFEFETPALCTPIPRLGEHQTAAHTEL